MILNSNPNKLTHGLFVHAYGTCHVTISTNCVLLQAK